MIPCRNVCKHNIRIDKFDKIGMCDIDKKEFYLCWELSECDSFNDISKEID